MYKNKFFQNLETKTEFYKKFKDENNNLIFIFNQIISFNKLYELFK
jgi:hypothetical protein